MFRLGYGSEPLCNWSKIGSAVDSTVLADQAVKDCPIMEGQAMTSFQTCICMNFLNLNDGLLRELNPVHCLYMGEDLLEKAREQSETVCKQPRILLDKKARMFRLGYGSEPPCNWSKIGSAVDSTVLADEAVKACPIMEGLAMTSFQTCICMNFLNLNADLLRELNPVHCLYIGEDLLEKAREQSETVCKKRALGSSGISISIDRGYDNAQGSVVATDGTSTFNTQGSWTRDRGSIDIDAGSNHGPYLGLGTEPPCNWSQIG